MNRAGRRRSRESTSCPDPLFERIELQPREEKARNECVSAIVGEHSPDLALESGGIAQAVALGLLKQRRIGRAVPERLARRVAISWLLARLARFAVLRAPAQWR